MSLEILLCKMLLKRYQFTKKMECAFLEELMHPSNITSLNKDLLVKYSFLDQSTPLFPAPAHPPPPKKKTTLIKKREKTQLSTAA